MPAAAATFVIRPQIWPRFLRWAVGGQLLLASLVVPVVVARGLNGVPLVGAQEVAFWGTLSGLAAGAALGLTLRRRNIGRADITPRGIRPDASHGVNWLYRWSEIAVVRLKQGPFGNRWLEVVPVDGPAFSLTLYPTDPAGTLEALEEFAGPDHPLTRAFAAAWEGDT